MANTERVWFTLSISQASGEAKGTRPYSARLERILICEDKVKIVLILAVIAFGKDSFGDNDEM